MSGWISCNKHGGQPPIHLCKHAYNKLENSISIDVIRFPIFGNLICLDCYNNYLKGFKFEKYSLANFDQISDEDFNEINDALDKIDKVVSCSKCIDTGLLIEVQFNLKI